LSAWSWCFRSFLSAPYGCASRRHDSVTCSSEAVFFLFFSGNTVFFLFFSGDAVFFLFFSGDAVLLSVQICYLVPTSI
jgi:hypothetical protein